ncbi:hypothetical protein Esti_000914 [Eimeria stiedai]
MWAALGVQRQPAGSCGLPLVCRSYNPQILVPAGHLGARAGPCSQEPARHWGSPLAFWPLVCLVLIRHRESNRSCTDERPLFPVKKGYSGARQGGRAPEAWYVGAVIEIRPGTLFSAGAARRRRWQARSASWTSSAAFTGADGQIVSFSLLKQNEIGTEPRLVAGACEKPLRSCRSRRQDPAEESVLRPSECLPCDIKASQ